MIKVVLRLAACVAAGCLFLPRPAAAQSTADMIDDGRAIAVVQCGQCHGLDDATRSPRPNAPPMRLIGRRYSFPVLEEELIQGIKLGHPDMPLFEFPPRGVDALIAYLRSIQQTDRTQPPAP
jgi:mono/diheme cytochrome c family protein